MIGPDVGDHVVVEWLDRAGEVTRKDSGWYVVEIDDALAASRMDGLVVPSHHARNRWTQRVGGPQKDLASSWVAGSELNAGACDLDGDEVVSEAEYEVAMIRRGNAIVTVLSSGNMKPPLRREVDAL